MKIRTLRELVSKGLLLFKEGKFFSKHPWEEDFPEFVEGVYPDNQRVRIAKEQLGGDSILFIPQDGECCPKCGIPYSVTKGKKSVIDEEAEKCLHCGEPR